LTISGREETFNGHLPSFFLFMKTSLSRYSLGLLLALGLPLVAVHGADRNARPETASVREATRSSKSGTDYVLQPQDVLRVHVFQHDDLNKQAEAVSISGDYTIYLPLIQTLNVRGKTVRQVEEMIRKAYSGDYLVNPQVSVIVAKYAERTANVIGAVNTPGSVKFPQERGLTIVEAISLAGGHSRLANLKNVKLTHKNADGETVTEEVNVDAMMKGGGREATILQKDDVIFVPERIL
jgi:protein involved in polysaccharide export with SLBB domain